MAATATATISSIEPTAPTCLLSAVLLHKYEAVGAKRPPQIRVSRLSIPLAYAGCFISEPGMKEFTKFLRSIGPAGIIKYTAARQTRRGRYTDSSDSGRIAGRK